MIGEEQIKLNLIERGIKSLSPAWAAKRAADRLRMEMLVGASDGQRDYEAGRRSRSTAGWRTGSGSSPNSNIRMGMVMMRERSRDLVRNNPYAKKAIEVLNTNTVGTGIRPSLSKTEVSEARDKKLMDAWRAWAETTECDFNGQFNFYGLMSLALRAVDEGGDCFIRRIPQSKYSSVPIKLQLLESDYLDHQRDGQVTTGGNYIIQGVEYTPIGERVAYWMYKHHPSENMPIVKDLMSVRIPADEILHMYEVLRPGQVRGVPQGVSAFLRIKDLDQYEDAQLKRQMIASCFSVVVRRNNPDFIDEYKQNITDRGAPDQLAQTVTPGSIDYLMPGEDINFLTPPGATGYDEYTKNILRSIAVAYGITYEALTADLSGVNFSSGRMGWLEMHRRITQRQDHLVIGMFCQPIWQWFLKAARLSGVMKGMDVLAEWTPPRREMIDPVKEAQGMLILIRAGLMTRSEAVRMLGDDPEKVLAEIIAEQKQADTAGLMLDSDAKHDANRVNFGADVYLKSRQKAAVANAA